MTTETTDTNLQPAPGQLWRNKQSGIVYTVIAVAAETKDFECGRAIPSGYKPVGQLWQLWGGSVVYLTAKGYPGIDYGTLVFAKRESGQVALTLADWLTKFTVESD